MSDEARTLYDVLGVDRSADSRAIRKAYLQASLRHHPDKNPADVEGAKRCFVRVGQAYEVLSDPVRRADYDRELLRDSGASWRERWQAAAAAASSTGSSASGNSNSDASASYMYDSYQAKFDAFVGGLSEEELQAAAGIASVVGSVVGSIVGARLGKGAGRALGTAGSLVGSMVGSRAGVGLVQSLHEQSVDRLTYEERKREAVARGEDVPERPPNEAWNTIRRSVSRAAESVAAATASASDRGTSMDANSGGNNNQKWRKTVGAAVNVAGAFATMSKANGSSTSKQGAL
mmetsp:Transcript_35245/g.77194  ORF Transcript_35245/g.77194 Transcript_35245/m.77194 type:complete len:290 (-) Transcript_35245:120-989(-)